jgi:hypothetical protein
MQRLSLQARSKLPKKRRRVLPVEQPRRKRGEGVINRRMNAIKHHHPAIFKDAFGSAKIGDRPLLFFIVEDRFCSEFARWCARALPAERFVVSGRVGPCWEAIPGTALSFHWMSMKRNSVSPHLRNKYTKPRMYMQVECRVGTCECDYGVSGCHSDKM